LPYIRQIVADACDNTRHIPIRKIQLPPVGVAYASAFGDESEQEVEDDRSSTLRGSGSSQAEMAKPAHVLVNKWKEQELLHANACGHALNMCL